MQTPASTLATLLLCGALAPAALAEGLKEVKPSATTTTDTVAIEGREWFRRMHFHGYGEVHFNFPETGTMNEDDPNMADFHRFVLGWSYDFSRDIRLDAEIDFEHNASEIELEYAQIEWDFIPGHSLRVGTLLMPVGSLNEVHEPTNYYSVERPYLQNSMIPTTWQESGFGLSGSMLEGDLFYRAYVVAGLEAAGFSSTGGLRGGRSKGVESSFEDAAFVGRIEYSPRMIDPKLNFGGSIYSGGAGQDTTGLEDVSVTLYTLDTRVRYSVLDIRAEMVSIDVDDAGTLSAFRGQTIGEHMFGWNAEVAAHVNSEYDTVIFARREEFDTNADAPSGYVANPAADREIWTFGVAFYPVSTVVFKADVESWKDGTDADLTRYNVGVGFRF